MRWAMAGCGISRPPVPDGTDAAKPRSTADCCQAVGISTMSNALYARCLASCLLGGLACGSLHAATLVRCVSTSGVVGFHAERCPAGHRLSRTIQYTPVADAPTRKALRSSGSAPNSVRPLTSSRARSNKRVGGRNNAPGPDACAEAKRRRKAAEERLGLRRRYDDLVVLDVPVRAACQGF